MPRQARLDVPGLFTLHHVMIRGMERSPIFNIDKSIKEICFKSGVFGAGIAAGSTYQKVFEVASEDCLSFKSCVRDLEV